MFHPVPPDNNGRDIISTAITPTSSASGSRGQQGDNDVVFAQSGGDNNDSDDENVARRHLSRCPLEVVTAQQRIRRPVSINVAPLDVGENVPAVAVARPRARIWAVLGSSGRNESLNQEHSRTPHKCQSNFGCTHAQRALNLCSQNGDNVSEADSLVPAVCEQIPSTQSIQSDTSFRRSRQASVCSTIDLETPVMSPSSAL